MEEVPSFEAYYAALKQVGMRRCGVEMSILELTMVVSALQLALRHPHFPQSMRAYVEPFVAACIVRLGQVAPVLGQGMQAGMGPTHDVKGSR